MCRHIKVFNRILMEALYVLAVIFFLKYRRGENLRTSVALTVVLEPRKFIQY